MTERFIVSLEVKVVIPDADPSVPCCEAQTVALLKEVQHRAEQGDRDWLTRHGRVYELVETT